MTQIIVDYAALLDFEEQTQHELVASFDNSIEHY